VYDSFDPPQNATKATNRNNVPYMACCWHFVKCTRTFVGWIATSGTFSVILLLIACC